MAITKRKTTHRRKTGAPKRKRKASVKEMPANISVNGHNYKKNTCHATKTEAKKAVERLHKQGFRATALKRGTRWCTFKGGVSPFWKRRSRAA